MEDAPLIPLSGKEAGEKILRDFMYLLLQSGMSSEEVAKQGFLFAERLQETLPVEPPLATPAFADSKAKSALLLRHAAQSLGIDLTSQRSGSEKQ